MNEEGFLPLELLQRFTAATIIAVALLLVFRASVALQRRFGKEEREADSAPPNHARTIAEAGPVLGIFIIAGSLVAGGAQGESWRTDARWLALFALVAGVLFVITGRIGVMMLLRSHLRTEVARGNVAAGVAAASHYVATALIVAGAVGGQGLKQLGISLTFFVLAQLTLHLFVVLFRALTRYDDHEEILGENLAAALSYAGITIGLGILIGQAVDGSFLGWGPSLKGYARCLGYGLSLYLVRQFLVQTLLLGARPTLVGGKLDELIGRQRAVGIGALEAVAYIGTALLLRQVS